MHGVGFAAGVERLLIAREALGVKPEPVRTPDIYLISLGARALSFNWKLAYELRRNGLYAAVEAEEKSMKSQMRSADRLKAARVLIVGDSELDSGTAVLKQMSDGSQRQIALNAVKEELFK